jgi:hypothetical protein
MYTKPFALTAISASRDSKYRIIDGDGDGGKESCGDRRYRGKSYEWSQKHGNRNDRRRRCRMDGQWTMHSFVGMHWKVLSMLCTPTPTFSSTLWPFSRRTKTRARPARTQRDSLIKGRADQQQVMVWLFVGGRNQSRDTIRTALCGLSQQTQQRKESGECSTNDRPYLHLHPEFLFRCIATRIFC